MRTPAHRLFARGSIAAIFLGVAAAWAADPPQGSSPAQAAPSKETREKMAVLHEQMAACLRSDKSIEDCRSAMMKSCHDTLGAQGCQMMGKGHGRMMQTAPASTPSGK